MSDGQYVKIVDKDEEEKEQTNKTSSKCSWEEKKSKIIFIIIFSIAVFTIEYLIRAPFTDLSEWIQERLNFSFKCELGSIFLWFKYQGKTIIFLFFYNFVNTYAAFMMIALDSFGIFINGSMKLIYTDARPFWRNTNLVPCGCATNYGNPSTTALDEYLVCIVIFRALINRFRHIGWKIFVWFLFLTPQVLAWTSRFIQNIHSLPQLCFGLACGWITQYIVFEIIEVNMDDGIQFKKFVTTENLWKSTLIILTCWVIANGVHILFVHIEYVQSEIDNILKYCKWNEFLMFDNESYVKTSKAFLMWGSIVGLYFEYYFIFDGNSDKYESYSMGEENWTNTPAWKTLIRIIIVVLVNKLVGPFIKFGTVGKDSLLKLNIGQCLIPVFIHGFLYFFVNKVIFRLLTLVNENGVINYENEKAAPTKI